MGEKKERERMTLMMQKRNMHMKRRCAGVTSGSAGATKRKQVLHASRSSRVMARRDARGAVTTKALPESGVAVASAAAVEVAQLAVYENEIWQTAGIVFGCTLLGLSLGFVLLKVESLVEESAD